MYGTPRSDAMRWMASARVRAWVSDSSTQGPAIRKRSGAPAVTGPMANLWVWLTVLLEHIGWLVRLGSPLCLFCSSIRSRRFPEGFHRNALVTHLQHRQEFFTSRS